MALKDWKKIGKNEWGNEKTRIMLDIEEINDWYDEVAFKKGYKWTVEIWGPHYNKRTGSNLNPKSPYFKTKQQALKYAKAYMRKH